MGKTMMVDFGILRQQAQSDPGNCGVIVESFMVHQRRFRLRKVFLVATFRYSQNNTLLQQAVNAEILFFLLEHLSLDLTDQSVESVPLVVLSRLTRVFACVL